MWERMVYKQYLGKLKRHWKLAEKGWMTRPRTTHMKNDRPLTALRREQRKRKVKNGTYQTRLRVYVKRSLDPMAKIRLQGVKLADPHLLNFWPGECSVRRNLNNPRSPHTLFYRYNKHPSLYAYIRDRSSIVLSQFDPIAVEYPADVSICFPIEIWPLQLEQGDSLTF